MRVLLIILIIFITNLSYSALRLKIIEPIRFGEVDIKAVGDYVVGEGAIEIFTDDLENDKDKKFVFRFPKKGLMTNKKRWVEIDKYIMKDDEKEFKLTKEKKIVKLYALIKRSSLNSQTISGEDLQGEYVGYVPIIVEQYSKPIIVEDETSEKNINNS